MKYIKTGLLFGLLVVVGVLSQTNQAQAQYYGGYNYNYYNSYNYGRTPSLSVVRENNFDSYNVTVSNADMNSRVVLYARLQGSTLWSTTIDPIGYTDQSGYLRTTVSNLGLNNNNVEFKISVNGTESTVVSSGNYGGCNYNCGSPTGLSLSQNTLTLAVGQTQTVTIYNNNNYYNNYNNYYIASNSNSSVVSANVSGSQINLYGLTNGNSTISVCVSGNSYLNQGCATLYVTVSGGVVVGNITFSQNNINLSVNQNTNVSIYHSVFGDGAFYISSNSNYQVVEASISGSTLYLTGKSQGSATLSVCKYNTVACGQLYVMVNSSGSGNYGYLTFSPSNPTVSVGQTQTVTIYNNNNYYNNSYYISNNTSQAAVTASVSGNILSLYGLNAGNANITVCQTSGNMNCSVIYVTVTGSGQGYGSLYFSTTYLPQPSIGQYYSQQLVVSGGNSPYNFTLTSGSLPPGLYLSTTGQIYGTPQSNVFSTFSVRVSDIYGRSATQTLLLNPIGGSSVLGSSTYRNGQLISENGTVYIVYKNTKTGFISAYVFNGLGYSFNQVVNVGYTGLLDSGYTVSSKDASHPWGAWIKSGHTVYFVHELGLIPVPSYDVFLNNNGQDNLVVSANSYDFVRPMLSPMVFNDSRLR